jgi:hypothetical protein
MTSSTCASRPRPAARCGAVGGSDRHPFTGTFEFRRDDMHPGHVSLRHDSTCCALPPVPPVVGTVVGHRYPADVIAHAVWLYFRFSLSQRDVEELMAERGVTVTYETIREWCAKFGPTYALQLRRRRPRPSDKWHLDEVQLKIKGKRHWLWRAVDKHGVVLDIRCSSVVTNTRPKHSYSACSRRRAASRGW